MPLTNTPCIPRHPFRIGIDLMGGDTQPHVLFYAAAKALGALSKKVAYTFFVDADFECFGKPIAPGVEWIEAGEPVSMEDSPLHAVRKKKNSSLLLGVKALGNRQIDAFVTTANTGALVAASRLFLKNEKNCLSKPALLVVLPGEKKPFCLLDAGASLHYCGDELVDLGKAGVLWHRSFFHSKTPKVALLNIGIESVKGRNEQKEAHQRLLEEKKKGHFIFMGNLEPQHLFSSGADVVVTEGFSGNIFLKAFEGTVAFLHRLKEKPYSPLKKKLHDEALPFAQLLGVSGHVIKCHGATSPEQFEKTLLMLPNLLKKQSF